MRYTVGCRVPIQFLTYESREPLECPGNARLGVDLYEHILLCSHVCLQKPCRSDGEDRLGILKTNLQSSRLI